MDPIRTVACAAGFALLAAGCGAADTEPKKPLASTTTDSKPAPLPQPVDLADLAGALDITAEPKPDWITIANGVAWVANVDHGIARFRSDGHRLGVVPTETEVCEAMGQGFGSVWAIDCISRQLIRMDARSGKLQKRIPLKGITPPENASPAVGPEGVFVIDGDHAIVRVDPETNQVDPQPITSADFPSALRAAYGSLWVTCTGTGVVSRLDPATGDLQAEVRLKPGIRFLTEGADSLWVLNTTEGTVERIDPATNTLVASIDVGEVIKGGDLAFGHGSVWARVTDAMVARIDPTTNAVTDRYGERAGGGSVAVDDTALWISVAVKLTVWRVLLD